MYLIDTDIVIWVLRGNPVYENILQQLKDKAPLSISSVTVAEVYKNIFDREFTKTEQVIREFIIWDVTANIAKQGGLYWRQFAKKFKNISIVDCIIAATASEEELTVLTLNTRHFPMKDIKVMDPLAKRK